MVKNLGLDYLLFLRKKTLDIFRKVWDDISTFSNLFMP